MSTDNVVAPASPVSDPSTQLRRSHVRFLADTPANKDAFGSRSPVATAMAAVVAREVGGRAIALEGAWGSGKSSIVEMFRKLVEARESPRIAVMSFDAWAHRGDPLRRSFIIECFKCLRDHGWIGADDAKTLQSEIEDLAIREHVERPTAPSGSSADKFVVLLSLLLAPAGLAMLSSGVEGWMRLSIPFVSVPVAVCITVWGLYALGRGASRARRRWLVPDSRLGRGLDRFAASHHTPPQERFWPRGGSLEEPEPIGSNVRDRTSIEFRSAFERVAGCALSGSDRRLVVVIDNLDRLDPGEVLDAWSAMRLFVELGPMGSVEDETVGWRRRVWLVVPYDPEGMRSLVRPGVVAASKARSSADAQGAVDRDEAPDAGDPKSAAESFIDKTFHIRFEAPPLLLTDWREHFKSLLRCAIPALAHEEAQVDDAYRVLSLGFAEAGRSPTPRELLLVVNDIAAIVMARGDGDRIPLEQIACYVWLRRRCGSAEQIRRRLLGAGGVGQVFEAAAGEHAALGVAMVLFGTSDEKKAAELLLREPLLGALRAGDHERLKQLAGGLAFWPAFEIIERSIQNESPQFSRMALVAIDRADLASAEYRVGKQVVQGVVRRLSHFRPEDRVDRANGDAYYAAIKLLANPEDTQRMLEQLGERRASWAKAGEADQSVPAPACDHAYVLARTVRAAVEFGGLESGRAVVRVTGNDEELAAVVGALRNEARGQGVEPRRFRIEPPSPHEWTKVLRPQPKRWPWPQWRTDAILMSSECGTPIDWVSVGGAVQELLGQHQVTTAAEAMSVGELFGEVRRHDMKAGQACVQNAVENGRAAAAIAILWNDKKSGAAMRWMALVMTQGDPLSEMEGSAAAPARLVVEALRAQTPEARDATVELARAVASLGTTEPFSNLFGNRVTYPGLIAGLVRTWIDDGVVARCVPAAVLAKQWPDVRAFFQGKDPDARAILGAIWPDADFQSRVKALGTHARAELQRDALDTGLFDGEVGRAALAEQLEAVSEQEWRVGLAEQSKLLSLAAGAASPPHHVRVGVRLKDALRGFADRLAAGESVWSDAQAGQVAAVVGCLADAQLEVLGADVLDQISKGQTNLPKVRLGCFGPAVEAALETMEPGSFIRGPARGALKSLDPQWIGWLGAVFAKRPHLWMGAKAGERTDYLSQLAAALETAPSNVRPALEGFRAQLSINPVAPVHVKVDASANVRS